METPLLHCERLQDTHFHLNTFDSSDAHYLFRPYLEMERYIYTKPVDLHAVFERIKALEKEHT